MRRRYHITGRLEGAQWSATQGAGHDVPQSLHLPEEFGDAVQLDLGGEGWDGGEIRAAARRLRHTEGGHAESPRRRSGHWSPRSRERVRVRAEAWPVSYEYLN